MKRRIFWAILSIGWYLAEHGLPRSISELFPLLVVVVRAWAEAQKSRAPELVNTKDRELTACHRRDAIDACRALRGLLSDGTRREPCVDVRAAVAHEAADLDEGRAFRSRPPLRRGH
jgi:hypothetical protein